MHGAASDNDESGTPRDRLGQPSVSSLQTSAIHHGEGDALGDGGKPTGHNVSDVRSRVSGIFQRHLLDTPRASRDLQRNDWYRPTTPSNAWPRDRERLEPAVRSAPATDGELDRDHLGSDDESAGGDPMEGDDDMRRGSLGADDMSAMPQEGNMEGDSTMTLENRRKRQSLRRGTACVRCRSKKLKCTGERPTCSVCANSKKPATCVYEEPPKKVPKIQRRQTRLQQIEAQIEERTQELEALQAARMNGEPLHIYSQVGWSN